MPSVDPFAYHRQLLSLEERYRRLARAAIIRLQSSALDARGLAAPPSKIDSTAEQVLERLHRLVRQSYQSGTKLGRRQAFAELDSKAVPRPRLPALTELPDAPALREALEKLDATFHQAVAQLKTYEDPSAALLTLKRATYATLSTAANRAYTDQSILVFKAAVRHARREELTPDQARVDAGVNIFGFGILIGIFEAIAAAIIDIAASFVIRQVGKALVPDVKVVRKQEHTQYKTWKAEHTPTKHQLQVLGHSRAFGACPQCRMLDGTKVEVNSNFPAPSNDHGPPLHPNCRCRLAFNDEVTGSHYETELSWLPTKDRGEDA
jgi:hypothetical protein